MKPLDSNDGALIAAASDSDEHPNARAVPSVPDSDADVPTPRAQSEIVAAAREASTGTSRVSRIVPLGTSDQEAKDDPAAPMAVARRESSVARHEPEAARGAVTTSPIISPAMEIAAANGSPIASSPGGATATGSPAAVASDPRERRALAHVTDFASTRIGTGFEPDDDDEETTVDAGAALTDDEREALARRIHSVMEETLPHGTPHPDPVHPAEGADSSPERRRPFKQTMLLGLPKLETPPPPPVVPDLASAAEPAVLASVVRVVGPPTQPPPRRSRRLPAVKTDEPSEPDHEAFVLTQPILPERSKPPSAPPPSKRAAELAARAKASAAVSSATAALAEEAPLGSADDPPVPAMNRVSVSSGYSSLPGVMLPPAPQPEDFAPQSYPSSPSIPPAPLLRASIEPPASLSRTRPPTYPGYAPSELPLEDLPAADPFAGFVAPPPSLAQRWLVVVVVALAVVGLCSLAAIAFGFLGKTGW